MNQNIALAELIKQPTFGVNTVRKLALENLAESVFIGYTLNAAKNKISIQTLYPNKLNSESPYRKFIEISLNKSDAKIAKLFDDVLNGVYLDKGEVLGDKLKEAVIVIREEHLNARLSYGTDPILIKVSQLANGENIVHFTSVKNGKRKTHQARWKLVDIASEVKASIIIPKNLFKTFREFDKLLSDLLKVDVGRFVYKQDPTTVSEDKMTVLITPQDLVYRGGLTVHLPPEGDEARLVPFNPSDIDPETPKDKEMSVVATFVDGAGKAVTSAKSNDTFKLKLTATDVDKDTAVKLLVKADKAEVMLDKEDITFTTEANTFEVAVSVISVTDKTNLTVAVMVDGKEVAVSAAVDLAADIKLTGVTVTPNTATRPPKSTANFAYTLTPAEYVPKDVAVTLSTPIAGVTVAPNKAGEFKLDVAETTVDGSTFDVLVTVDGVVGKTAITIKAPETNPEGK